MKKWLAEHRLFTILSSIILALLLIIIVSFVTAGGSTVIGRGIQSGVSYIQRPLSGFTNTVKQELGGIFKYRQIQKENKKLKEELEKLEKENRQLQIAGNELKELRSLSKSFDFRPFSGNGKAVAARVISIDNSNPYVVFTVDAGTEKNIKKDDIVVDGNGLIGRVQEAGKGYSKIVSIISNKNSISFSAQRKSSITGVLKGDGHGKLTGYVMNQNMSILKGDKLITSGIGIYPQGILIGTVKTIDYDEDRQLKVVTVEPTVNFSALQKVAIYYEY